MVATTCKCALFLRQDRILLTLKTKYFLRQKRFFLRQLKFIAILMNQGQNEINAQMDFLEHLKVPNNPYLIFHQKLGPPFCDLSPIRF